MSSTFSLEPVYIVDTHALFWFLVRDKKLSARAQDVFEGASRGETRLVISAIVLAELYHLNLKQGKPLDYSKVYQELASDPAYLLYPFEPAHVLDFVADAAVTELHDRIIAGLARRLDAPLLTVDPIITASGVVRIEW